MVNWLFTTRPLLLTLAAPGTLKLAFAIKRAASAEVKAHRMSRHVPPLAIAAPGNTVQLPLALRRF